MSNTMEYPLLVFMVSFIILWLAAKIGASINKRWQKLDGEIREDFGVIQAATLTLLGLIIGFTFSMAVNRYDLRKTYEEAEANAIGTEYVRADFLPPADAAKVRSLLGKYLDERIVFYTTRNEEELRRIDACTSQLQAELWDAVRAPAAANPTPVITLSVSGMNDVLNSHGRTQAAWWNRIPISAWVLMAVIAVGCCSLIGYGSRNAKMERMLLLILPLVVSISFFLIADIDSPRGGVIRVHPQSLITLRESFDKH